MSLPHYQAQEPHAGAGASYSRPGVEHLQLQPRSARSWTCPDGESLAAWLCRRWYSPVEVRSPHELVRLRKRDRLVVIFHSGSVVAQGLDWAGVAREFAQLVRTAGGVR